MKEVDKDALTRAVDKKLSAVLGFDVEPLTKEELEALVNHIINLEEEYEDVVY